MAISLFLSIFLDCPGPLQTLQCHGDIVSRQEGKQVVIIKTQTMDRSGLKKSFELSREKDQRGYLEI